jgi:hypothetical protein
MVFFVYSDANSAPHNFMGISRLITGHLAKQNLIAPMILEVISNDRNTKQSHSMLKLRPSKF